MRLIDADAISYELVDVGYIPVITKEEIDAMPTANAIPIKFIKGELKRLRANLIDADPDDVGYAWYLKMKIEALSDLLGAWEDTYETD